jgi:DHA1 family bicyclomycin/chloramphenicol resistance-like MFS transporter
VAITATGTLAMHILVPVLPLVAADCGVSRGTIQLAITLYCSALPAANCCTARSPTSLAGGRPCSSPLVSVLASAVAGRAAGITTLLIARIGQAVGGCGGLVLGRAIVRDSAGSGQATSRMALLTMVQSLAPGLGPPVGGFLGAWFGWRSIFVALVALGIVTLGGVWSALPETAASRGIAGSGRMLGSYLALLRSRSFRGYMFGGAFTSTSFYAYLTASPFIFTEILHRPATEVGLYYLAVMSGVPIGSFASSRLATRVRLTLLLRVTSAVAVLAPRYSLSRRRAACSTSRPCSCR